MEEVKEMNICLICSELCKTTIFLFQVLPDCDNLSLVAILEKLQFFKAPDTVINEGTLCHMCVARIHSCYDFKTLCQQSEQRLYQQIDIAERSTENRKEVLRSPQENSSCFSNTVVTEDFSDSDDFRLELSSSEELPTEVKRQAKRRVRRSIKISDQTKCFKYRKRIAMSINNDTTKPPELPPKTISCAECNEMFWSKKTLRFHLKQHRVRPTYPCSQCDKTFRTRKIWKSHLAEHRRRNTFTCLICHKSAGLFHKTCHLSSERNLVKNHSQKHIAIRTKKRLKPVSKKKCYTCSVCNETFKSKHSLEKHTEIPKIHENGKINELFCYVCQEVLDTKDDLDLHDIFHKEQQEIITCPICQRSYLTVRGFTAHLVKHEGVPLLCSICDTKFPIPIDFANHMAIHSKLICDLFDNAKPVTISYPSSLRTYPGKKKKTSETSHSIDVSR